MSHLTSKLLARPTSRRKHERRKRQKGADISAGAAVNYKPPQHASLSDPTRNRLTKLFLTAFFGVLDLVRRPAYFIPFLLNVTGSVWFFLLIGRAELSLTVPITNSLAFLFTVLGEWIAEGKVISRGALFQSRRFNGHTNRDD